MTSSKKISPEVLIYIQNLRQYFKSNDEAMAYFDINENDEDFFNHLSEISQENFEETGEPELSLLQFEHLKQKITGSLPINKEIKTPEGDREIITSGVFLIIGDFGYLSLN